MRLQKLCQTCNKEILSSNFKRHEKSKLHNSKLNPNVEYKEIQTDKIYCNVCEKELLKRSFKRHEITQTHNKKLIQE